VGTHAIARAAYKSGVKPKVHEDELGYKIETTKPPEKEASQKPKKKYVYKPNLIRKTKDKIKARLSKDDW